MGLLKNVKIVGKLKLKRPDVSKDDDDRLQVEVPNTQEKSSDGGVYIYVPASELEGREGRISTTVAATEQEEEDTRRALVGGYEDEEAETEQLVDKITENSKQQKDKLRGVKRLIPILIIALLIVGLSYCKRNAEVVEPESETRIEETRDQEEEEIEDDGEERVEERVEEEYETVTGEVEIYVLSNPGQTLEEVRRYGRTRSNDK